jgi:hypothetical protein
MNFLISDIGLDMISSDVHEKETRNKNLEPRI